MHAIINDRILKTRISTRDAHHGHHASAHAHNIYRVQAMSAFLLRRTAASAPPTSRYNTLLHHITFIPPASSPADRT
jgi:hypothetical protein